MLISNDLGGYGCRGHGRRMDLLGCMRSSYDFKSYSPAKIFERAISFVLWARQIFRARQKNNGSQPHKKHICTSDRAIIMNADAPVRLILTFPLLSKAEEC